jgi:glutamate 5-kinase
MLRNTSQNETPLSFRLYRPDGSSFVISGKRKNKGVGTGGIISKLDAAYMATQNGIGVIICRPENLVKAVEQWEI